MAHGGDGTPLAACPRLHGKLQQFVTEECQAECNRRDSARNLWAFVFGSRTAPICALYHRALGAHTPRAHKAAVSRFPCLFAQFFSRSGHSIFFQHDSPSNLALSRYPCVTLLLQPRFVTTISFAAAASFRHDYQFSKMQTLHNNYTSNRASSCRHTEVLDHAMGA